VADQTIRQRYVQYLLEQVRADPFPSIEHMNMLEATVRDPDQLVDYLEMLMDKVESTRFPSLGLLRRIQRIAAQLPA
jgi:hypothetical protein